MGGYITEAEMKYYHDDFDSQNFYPKIQKRITNKQITYSPKYKPYNIKPNMQIKDRFSVAGVQYSDYQKIKGPVKIGTVLRAMREPKNPHDPKAIALYYGAHRIGYVPNGNMKTTIIKHKQAGVNFKFVLTSVNKQNPTWGLFTVEVTGDKSLEEAIGINNTSVSEAAPF